VKAITTRTGRGRIRGRTPGGGNISAKTASGSLARKRSGDRPAAGRGEKRLRGLRDANRGV